MTQLMHCVLKRHPVQFRNAELASLEHETASCMYDFHLMSQIPCPCSLALEKLVGHSAFDNQNSVCVCCNRDAGSLDLQCFPLNIALQGLNQAAEWVHSPPFYSQLFVLLRPLLKRLYAYEGGQRDAELGFKQENPRSRDGFSKTLSGQAVGDLYAVQVLL